MSVALDEHLHRVSDRIRGAILEFCKDATDFHADDLRRHVTHRCGAVAPGSADRVLRELRKRGELNYVVLNRRQSLYRMVRHLHQSELF